MPVFLYHLNIFGKLAEAEGFEPPEPCGSAVFKTASIDHSDKPPEHIDFTRRIPTGKGYRYIREQLTAGKRFQIIHHFLDCCIVSSRFRLERRCKFAGFDLRKKFFESLPQRIPQLLESFAGSVCRG
jgi:hypothetical protein